MIFGIGFCAISEVADSFRYVEKFMIEHNYTWSQYMMEINEYFTFESNIKDIYTLTVNFFVGRFTNNYHWTYFIYAAVFGFFYIKSLKIFLRHNNVSNNIVFYALLFMFCYSNPIYNINGVRFWTAAWIGVYVALSVFVEKDYKKLPLLILLPLVHGSSVIWVVIMAIALLLSRFQNISGVSQYGKAYADFLIALPGYFQILLSYLLILNRKEINRDKRAGYVLTIMLALAAITNFLSGIPSMGRFKALVIPMLVIVWAYNYRILKKYDKYFNVVPFIYAYSLLYWYRRMSAISELYLYIFPAPLTVIKYLFL